jgi:hypothetical protein
VVLRHAKENPAHEGRVTISVCFYDQDLLEGQYLATIAAGAGPNL